MKDTWEPIIRGAVHLPYYGRNNPLQSYGELEEYALVNVRAFTDNGINTVYIQDENLNPGPAYPETIALLSSLDRLLKAEIKHLKLGFIIQAHDGIAPIATAAVTGADFVRIKVFAGSMYKADGSWH